MSGMCYGCATKFSFFKKELGCKNCGFTFCKDCLKKKATVPKQKDEMCNVCNRCHDILTGKIDSASQQASYCPPEAYSKRIAALNNPQPSKAKPTHPAPSTSRQSYYPASMMKEDIAIAQRLDKLKEARKKVDKIPGEKEIRQRLDALRKPVQMKPLDSVLQPSTEGATGTNTDIATSKSAAPTAVNPIPPQMAGSATGNTPKPPDEVYRLMSMYTDLVHTDQKYNPDQSHLAVSRDALPPHTSYQGDPILDAIKSLERRQGDDSVAITQEAQELARLVEATALEVVWKDATTVLGDAKDFELRARLHKLKGSSSNQENPTIQTIEDGEESEETTAEKALQELLERTALERASGDQVFDEEHIIVEVLEDAIEVDPEDQLPWCCICNNDACLLCYGCDGDLYCNRCYREGHVRADYADHKTKKFIPTTGSSDVG